MNGIVVAMPEWMMLAVAPFVCTVACGGVIGWREGRLSRTAAVDVGLALGGILVIGLNKEVFAPCVRNFITAYIDHFVTCPAFIAAGNLLLVALRRTPWRSFGRCVALSLCIGLFLEFAYPHLGLSGHIGGDWFDVAVYVAGGIVLAFVYRFFATYETRMKKTSKEVG